jgi:hypothetical protein
MSDPRYISDLLVDLQPIQLRLFELRVQVRQIADERKRLMRQRARLIASGKKVCRKCNEEMDSEQFYVDDRYRDGLYPYCRECKSTMVKARNAA